MERQRILNEQKAAEAQAEKKKSRKLSKRSGDDPMDLDEEEVEEEVEEEEEEEEDEDEENQLLNKSKSSAADNTIDTGLTDDLPPNSLLTPSGTRLPSQSPFAPKRKAFAMFPYKEEIYICDDYGEIINPDDYMIVETKPTIATDLSSMNFGDSDERHPLSEILDITNTNMMMMMQQTPAIVPHNQSQHPLIQQVQHQPSTIPFKTLREKRQLKINAKVLYVDFEARSDRESIEKLLNQIKPKNLILIHGTQDCIEQLEKYCTTRQIVQGRIFSPHVGEIVDATTERNLYQVNISFTLKLIGI
jgi:cleavage and polyadenylation specificity factor subunit 2